METWKLIPGYGTRYLVSDQGRVYSNITKIIMDGGQDRDGYRIVTLSLDGKQKTHKVHGLVCELFCGPRPKGGCVCHANDIRDDNRAENLSWGTPAENSAQMRERNRSPQGAKNHQAKLTHFQVFMIREGDAPVKPLAKALRISWNQLYAIKSKANWKSL